MQTPHFLKPLAAVSLALATLSACGGGGGSAIVDDVDVQPAIPITAPNTLSILSLNTEGPELTRQTGVLDANGIDVQFGNVAGTLSADRTNVETSEGAITFEDALGSDPVRFSAALGAVTTSGLVGLTPDPADLPTGTASYLGDATITAISGDEIFELTGHVTVTAAFGNANPIVDTVVNGLAGTRQTALTAPTMVNNAGSLTISGSAIDGVGFSGGTVDLESTEIGLSDAPSLTLEGAFFGATGSTVGGVFAVEDSGTLILGDFLAR